ncbi:hypothetical protein D3C78_1427120 [compost metagenome]
MLAVGQVDRCMVGQIGQDVGAALVDDAQLVEQVADDQAVAHEGGDVDLPAVALVLVLQEAQRLVGAADGACRVCLEGACEIEGVALEAQYGLTAFGVDLEGHAGPQHGDQGQGQAEDQRIGAPAVAGTNPRAAARRRHGGWRWAGDGLGHVQVPMSSRMAGSGWSA